MNHKRISKLLLTLCLPLTTLSAAVTVTVTSPAGGSTSASPVHIIASGSSAAAPMSGWDVYADNQLVWRINSGAALDAWVVLPFGTRSMQVKGFDNNGNSGASNFTLNVSGTTIPTPPQTAISIANLEDDTSAPTYFSGWDRCGESACSGTSKGIPTPTLSFFQNQPNPDPVPPTNSKTAELAMTGVGGADGLWWYKAGHSLNQFRNFIWDYWFYIPSSSQRIQATEFDFFQYFAGTDASNNPQLQRLMWGTQCNYKAAGGPVWDSWNDVVQHWIPAVPNNNNATNTNPTGAALACSPWTTNTWHHLQYFVQREFDDSLLYGNVTVDGVTSQWNISAPLKVSTACSLSDPNCPVTGVQYQLDISGASSTQTSLQELLDLIKVTAW